MANKKRPKESYRIDSVEKALRVLEAVESETGRPIPLGKIIGRTGFSRDFCTRALATFEINGYVAQVPGKGWVFGARFLRVAYKAGGNI
jgi:DNA-binding IclR family transcriptional regulator